MDDIIKKNVLQNETSHYLQRPLPLAKSGAIIGACRLKMRLGKGQHQIIVGNVHFVYLGSTSTRMVTAVKEHVELV